MKTYQLNVIEIEEKEINKNLLKFLQNKKKEGYSIKAHLARVRGF